LLGVSAESKRLASLKANAKVTQWWCREANSTVVLFVSRLSLGGFVLPQCVCKEKILGDRLHVLQGGPRVQREADKVGVWMKRNVEIMTLFWQGFRWHMAGAWQRRGNVATLSAVPKHALCAWKRIRQPAGRRMLHSPTTRQGRDSEQPPCREISVLEFAGKSPSQLAAIFAKQEPLVIRQYASTWPAASAWRDLDALAARAHGGDGGKGSQSLLVPVEVGGRFLPSSPLPTLAWLCVCVGVSVSCVSACVCVRCVRERVCGCVRVVCICMYET